MGEFAQVRAKIFWHKKITVPIPIPNSTPSLDTGFITGLEPDPSGASGSTTLRPQFI